MCVVLQFLSANCVYPDHMSLEWNGQHVIVYNNTEYDIKL